MKEIEIQALYNALFDKYYANLLFYATRFLSEDEAEDVVQDVFVELWQRRNQVEIGNQIQSFLYRAVYTRSINVLKHKQVAMAYNSEAEEFYRHKMDFYNPDKNDVIRRLENQELGREVVAAINELPDKCKAVFRLSYLYEMKNKEIAETLNISLRTVEAHMYKALKYLRSRLSHLTSFFVLFSFGSKCFFEIGCFMINDLIG
ncbi:MAG: RNA polymerase sigma-70 factor [Bacteroidales bacterium]